MKTILSHFYNEEYLLPFWLNYHKKFFDHGIMIDYQSTDKSVDIIKELCPTWEIVKTRNSCFDANAVDKEVEYYESTIDGWRICLNTTEFLIGDFSTLLDDPNPSQKLIRLCLMIESKELLYNQNPIKNLLKERTNGLTPEDADSFNCNSRLRSLHNFSLDYPLGRHFTAKNSCKDFIILKYVYSPWNQEIIKRKLQIKHKMSQSDIKRKLGYQHTLTLEQMNEEIERFQTKSQDLSAIMKINEIPLMNFL